MWITLFSIVICFKKRGLNQPRSKMLVNQPLYIIDNYILKYVLFFI